MAAYTIVLLLLLLLLLLLIETPATVVGVHLIFSEVARLSSSAPTNNLLTLLGLREGKVDG